MSTCYYPNGDISNDGDIPCSGSDACCPLNWSCQSNGLCYLANENYYGRYTCTDKTWQSSGCPNICTHNNTAAGNEAILECSTGNYCCDANRPTQGCCDTSTDRFQLQNIGSGGSQPTSPAKTSSSSAAPTSSSTSSPTSTSSRAVSSSANATPTLRSITLNSGTASSSSSGGSKSSPNSNSPSISTLISVVTEKAGGSSTLVTSSSVATAAPASSNPTSAPASSKNLGVIIGPVVAGVVGTLLVVLTFILIRRRRKQKGASAPPPMTRGLQPMYGDDNKDLVDSPYTGKSELEGSPSMSVIPAGTPRKGHRTGNEYHTPDDVGQGGATYRGVPTIAASPMVGRGGARDSTELAASPSTARSPQSRRSELPGDNAVRNAVGKVGQPAELPAGGAYKPHKPPGATGLGVEL